MALRHLSVLILLLSPLASAGENGSADATSLDPIIVHPRPDPFDESMQQLRKSMEDPACRGCPPELRAYRKSVYERMGEFVGYFTGIGLEPPQLSPADRVQQRVREDWRKQEWGPEMDDFR